MPSVAPRSNLAVALSGPSAPPEPPPPGALETLAASFKGTQADATGTNVNVRNANYGELIGALVDLGHDGTDFMVPTGVPGVTTYNHAAVWEAAMQEKARGHFKELPDTQEEWDRSWIERWNKGVEANQQTAARGPGWARFVGGMGGAMADPVNIATLPFGGFGRTAIRAVATEALANMAVETVLTPTINAQRREFGRDEMTWAEAGMNIAFAGAGAAVFRGGLEAGAKIAPVFRAKVHANLGKLPAPLRERWRAALLKGGDPLDDPLLYADVYEALTPRDAMGGTEAAAVDVLRREGQIDAGNPFRRNGAGAELYDAMMADTLARALADHPFEPLSRPAGRAVAPGGGEAPGPVAPSSLAVEAESRFMAKVRRAESGGSDAAANPRSSAQGRYQFTDGTWLAYWKRRFGSGGLSDAQILLRKSDGRMQDLLMQDLTADNAAFLRAHGEAVSEGNLYLVHFAGQGAARRIFEADPAARLESVLGKAAVDANPFLRGKTAGWLVRWAHGKMDVPAPRRGGARIELDPDSALARNAAEAARIQDALDNAVARADALAEEARIAAGGAPDHEAIDPAALGESLAPLDLPDRLPERGLEPAAETPLAPEVQALLPELRKVVAERERSLNQVEQLADELGAAPEDVRAALDELVAEGSIARRSDTGTFMRKPPAPARGDLSLLEWIGRRGGIEDRGGDFHAMGLDRWHRDAPFRARLIRPHDARQPSLLPGGGFRENSPEALFEAAISDGYFPELAGRLSQAGADAADMGTVKPDLAVFHRAIADEMAGTPRYAVDSPRGMAGLDEADAAAARAAWDARMQRYHDEYRAAWDGEGLDPEAYPTDPELLADVAYRLGNGDAASALGALEQAADERYRYAMELLVDEGMEADYGRTYDIFDPAHADEYARRLAERLAASPRPDGPWNDGFPAEPRGPGGGGGGEGGDRGGGQGPQGGPDPGSSPGQALADLTPEDRAPFADPDSEATKLQAESLEHDARMAAQADYERLFDSPQTPREAADLLGPEKGDPERADWMKGWASGRKGDAAPEPDNAFHDGWTVGNNTFKRQGALDVLRGEVQQSDGLGTLGREDYKRRFGSLWLKTPDELDALFEQAKLSEAAQLQRSVDLIGLTPSEGLARTLHSEGFNWDRAAARIEKEAEAAGLEIPPEADRILNPMWDDPPANDLPMSEDVKQLQHAVAAGADNDQHMLASEIGWALRDLKDEAAIRSVLDGSGTIEDQARMLTVRLATERLAELGVPQAEIPARVHAAMVRNGVDEATATELTQSIFDAFQRGAAPPPDALPAPKLDAAPDGQMDFAAPTQDQRRIALERQMEGRMKGKAGQKPPGSDGGLFDNHLPDVRLDENGEARPVADLLDEFDREAAELKAIRDCLPPKGPAE